MLHRQFSHARRRRILNLATLGIHFFEGGDPAGGGGGGSGGADKLPEKKPDPKKIELTDEELQARIENALKDERDKQATAKKKEEDEAKEKAAKEKGEFKELSEKRDAENAELRLQIRRTEVREQIREYIAEHHAAYVGSEKYILPLIDFDAKTSADDIAKKVKASAEQFVKDNPRTPAPKGGVGGQPPRSGVPSKDSPKNGGKGKDQGGGGNGTQDAFSSYINRRYPGPTQAAPQN